MIIEESEAVPPYAEDLSPVNEKQGGSSQVEPIVIATGDQKRGWKRSLPKNDDDAYKSLLKRETKKSRSTDLSGKGTNRC